MSRHVKEMNVKEFVFIADKGFYSQDNIRMLDEEKLQYIIPLRRNNTLIDFSRFQKADYKKKLHNNFSCQNRIICYYVYEKDGMKLVTFLDEHLRVSEENDYLQRTKRQPEQYAAPGFYEKLHQFGTLTMLYKTSRAIQANEIYEIYKQRNEIEVMFDSIYGSPANPCVFKLQHITFVLKNHSVRKRYVIRMAIVNNSVAISQ
ncbi:hypothetical protein EZS27_008763 [termite gut metagenome]|uniref:Transposase IS4-like domain-containing protein n=1 Tax=termite gut metagenome TaxID=433724 RepID=A0A5J4SDY1_9ZZZZ